jgi:hypothetical protein
MTISDLNGIISTGLALATAAILGLFVIYGRKLSRKFLISAFVVLAFLLVPYFGLVAYVSHTTIVSINGRTSISSLVNPSPTDTPTATPSPTPTPKVIPINQTMTCTDCPAYHNYSLMVRSATIDPAKSQTTFLIGVQNLTTSTDDISFAFLKLQDTQTGATSDGAGDGFSYFMITAQQLILVRPTFQFVPVAGHEYSLSAQMSGFYSFSPITIKF